MNTFKRLIISVKSQIDQATEGLENHEALAEAAIQEMEALRQHTGRQLFRLRKSLSREQAMVHTLEEEIVRWAERAIRIRPRDEDKALACIRRMKETETRKQSHLDALTKIKRQLEQTQKDLSRIESKLDSMRNRKLLLAAQQSHGQTHTLLRTPELEKPDLEAIFDRWEDTVADFCVTEEPPQEPDLEEEFRMEEEQAECKAILDQLTQNPPGGDQD